MLCLLYALFVILVKTLRPIVTTRPAPTKGIAIGMTAPIAPATDDAISVTAEVNADVAVSAKDVPQTQNS